MPTHLVNLDALIQRRDFEALASKDDSAGMVEPAEVIKIGELEHGRQFYRLLRKPDFQRETANWSPEKVVGFVKSFLDGEVIPSIIMWYSPRSYRVFVVDGAHRLSALIAWVNNDYGDGEISRPFFGGTAAAEQIRLAKRTSDLIETEIGTYEQLQTVDGASAHSDKMKLRARNMALLKIEAQWIKSDDAQRAERAFLNINDNPATIDKTELDVIKARRKPNAIATRALMRAGTGLQYGSKFPEETKAEIQKLAREVYTLLFTPVLQTPIKTLDLPIAGQAYSGESFKMIFDMVNIFNELTPSMWRKPAQNKKTNKPRLADDVDGSATIACLKNVKKAGLLISPGKTDKTPPYVGSLGLSSAVYFYGADGKFHPPAFLAALKFAQELKKADDFEPFTKVRAKFEDFLLRHKNFLTQIRHAKGSRLRPVDATVTMYKTVFEEMSHGHFDDNKIVAKLQADPKLKDLKAETVEEDSTQPVRKRFPKEVLSAAYLRDSIDSALRCKECNARLDAKSMSPDHIKRAEDGGMGELDNAQWTHPYCNSGFKEARHAREKKAARETRCNILSGRLKSDLFFDLRQLIKNCPKYCLWQLQ
jgi:hypothetical protein